MTTLAHLLIFNWFGRQKFGQINVWMATRDQLCAPEETSMWKMLKFWQFIKDSPRKAFKDKFLLDVIIIRGATCKVFQNQYNHHWTGQIQLQQPNPTPLCELNNWLIYITEMLSKVLTRRKFLMCREASKLYLLDASYMITADASIQTVAGWSKNAEDCRLIYFDGTTDIHQFVYFGLKVQELFIVVKPDENMNSITRSLEFWRGNGIPIKITLIHNDAVKEFPCLLCPRCLPRGYNCVCLLEQNFDRQCCLKGEI